MEKYISPTSSQPKPMIDGAAKFRQTYEAAPVPGSFVRFDPTPGVTGSILVAGTVALVIVDASGDRRIIARIVSLLADRSLTILSTV